MRFKIYHLPQTTTEPTETEPNATVPEVNESDVAKADVIVPDARVPLASENFPRKQKCCTFDEETPNQKSQSDLDIWSDSLNIKMSDRSLVEEGLELNDRAMDAVSQLLKNQFPHLKGLQLTLVIKTPEHCDFVGLHCNSVQINHQESRHHLIACAVKDSEIFIYDSLQPERQLPSDTKQVLQNLYGNVKNFITTDVTQQTGGVDCGLFAIAFITAISHGIEPEDFCFNQQLLRKH